MSKNKLEIPLIGWFETKGKLHLGDSFGKPGKWTAHALCNKRLRKWIGFKELKYAKNPKADVCIECAVAWLFLHPSLTNPNIHIENRELLSEAAPF